MTRRRATLALTAGVALLGLGFGGLPTSQAAAPVSAHLTRAFQGADSGDFPGAEVPVGDQDKRGPRRAPLAAAKEGLHQMGAGLQVSWTQYGTPLSVTREKDFLARGLTGTPEQKARTYLKTHSAIWGLSPADVDRLQLVNDERMPQSTNAWSVSFNQVVNGMLVAEDGYVVVGVVDDKVALVTSSLVPTALLGSPSMTPKISVQKAVLAAARNAGITGLSTADLKVASTLTKAGFQSITVKGLAQKQLARLRVMPTTNHGAKLAFETLIQDVAGAHSLAVTSYVDAITGGMLLRRDNVHTLSDLAATPSTRAITSSAAGQGTVGGSYGKACSTKVPAQFTPGDRTVVFAASAVSDPQDDITANIYLNGTLAASGDTLSSPEAATASFGAPGLLPTDKLTVAVCPYDAGSEVGTKTWQGFYVTSNVAAPGVNLPTPLTNGSTTGPATYKAFASNPELAVDGKTSPDDGYHVCSGKPGEGANPFMKDLSKCNYVFRSTYADQDTATSGPNPLDYDADPITGLAGTATIGNVAVTTNAQESSSLTPGAPGNPYIDPTRNYAPAFTDSWHTTKCDPSTIAGPTGADINQAIVNLFLGHNRVHDFSYRLGLTEKRGVLQINNFGVTGTNVAEDDPEIGNAQNAALSDLALRETAAVTGPAAGIGLTGRDNANQITMMDGVPGITNQYLFQPVVGFYAPCTDGDLDASVFLHEFTHATSNRLIAGPATGLSGQQGGSMGESWSDLTAIEYLNAFGLAGSRGEDPFALGAYATGDAKVGIRDFNLAPSKNPLNYSDFGFDTTGPEVHADGEIWNAIQMTVREALIKKYDAQFPHTDKALQAACALGRNANGSTHSGFAGCPGNRRYITYQYDAMILQANGAPSMVDMKNVELAAIMMRAPADYDTVADAFASRGLGVGSSSKTGDDTTPVPSFASPKTAKNAHVTFKLVDANTGKPVKASVFIGRFTARCRPIATTLGGKELGPKAEVLAGTYTLSVQGKGYGIQRFEHAFTAGTQTVTLPLSKNLASTAYGPAISASTGAHRIGGINDDSEVTNGAFDGKVKGSSFTVKLGGGLQTFDRVAVSALHHVALPAAGEEPAEFQGRLLGLHDFQIQASSNGGASFTTVYTSPAGFFPTKAPRATAGMLVIREAKLSKPVKANAVRLVVLSNTCTGTTQFHTEQENDPLSASDCTSVATNASRVTVTELEVFAAGKGSATTVTPVVNPPVIRKPTAGSGTGSLPATGLGAGVGLGGFVLLGMGGVVWMMRRRTI